MTASALACRSEPYPGVAVQETAGGDGVQECLVRCNNVVQVLGLLHSVPQLIPGALENLEGQVETRGRACSPHRCTTVQGRRLTHLKGDVVLHLVNEVHHLRGQDVALVKHPRELCKRRSAIREGGAGARTDPYARRLPGNEAISKPNPEALRPLLRFSERTGLRARALKASGLDFLSPVPTERPEHGRAYNSSISGPRKISGLAC